MEPGGNIIRKLREKNLITVRQAEQLLNYHNDNSGEGQKNREIEGAIGSGRNVYNNLAEAVTSKDEGQPEGSVPPEVQGKLNDPTSRFGKYILICKLGAGGSGTVYKAYDRALERYMALKVIEASSEDEMQRIEKEAKTVAALEHPNIVPIYEVGAIENKHYISMKYIDGRPLQHFLSTITPEECLRVASRVCDALMYSHKRGIIHRDIKPGNILIDNEKNVYVVDFGIAKDINSVRSTTGNITGTPAYMSPEQVRLSAIDNRTDIYGLGATIYHCITRNEPVRGITPVELLSSIIDSNLTPPGKLNPAIPKELESIIMKCMRNKPYERYQSAKELKGDIEDLLSGRSVSTKGTGIALFVSRHLTSKKTIVTATLLLITASLYLFFYGEGGANKFSATKHFERGSVLLNKAISSPMYRENFSALLKEAIGEFNHAIEADQAYAGAYLLRGKCYYYMLDMVGALRDFDSAVDANKSISEAYIMRVLITLAAYYELLPFEDKEGYLEEIEENAIALKRLGTSISLINYAEAATIITRESISVNDLRRAIEHLNESVLENPGFALSYLMRAVVRKELSFRDVEQAPPGSPLFEKRIAKIIHDLSKALEIEPNNPFAHDKLVQMLRVERKYEEALKHVRILQALYPGNPITKLLECTINLSMGDRPEALRALDKTHGEEDNIYDKKNKALFYMERGIKKYHMKLEGAKDDIQMALKLFPGDKDRFRRYVENVKRKVLK